MVAPGIDRAGKKHILVLWQGDTESAEVFEKPPLRHGKKGPGYNEGLPVCIRQLKGLEVCCGEGVWRRCADSDPIESCFSVTMMITGRVKRWRGGEMLQMWAVASILSAKKRFKRVKGYRENSRFIAILDQKSIDRKEVTA